MLNVNEIRRFEGMNGIGEKGDIHLQPLNFVELGSGYEQEPMEPTEELQENEEEA